MGFFSIRAGNDSSFPTFQGRVANPFVIGIIFILQHSPLCYDSEN